MLFHRIIASDFPDGGTHLSFAFGEFNQPSNGPGVSVSGGNYITAGFPGGAKAGWTQKEVADQLRKLADHLEREVDKLDAKGKK